MRKKKSFNMKKKYYYKNYNKIKKPSFDGCMNKDENSLINVRNFVSQKHDLTNLPEKLFDCQL